MNGLLLLALLTFGDDKAACIKPLLDCVAAKGAYDMIERRAARIVADCLSTYNKTPEAQESKYQSGGDICETRIFPTHLKNGPNGAVVIGGNAMRQALREHKIEYIVEDCGALIKQ